MANNINETLFSNKTGRPTLPIQNMDLTGTEVTGRRKKDKPYKTMEDAEEEEQRRNRSTSTVEESATTKRPSINSTSNEVKIHINKKEEIVLLEDGDPIKGYDNIEEALKDLRNSINSDIDLSRFSNGECQRQYTLSVEQRFSFG